MAPLMEPPAHTHRLAWLHEFQMEARLLEQLVSLGPRMRECSGAGIFSGERLGFTPVTCLGGKGYKFQPYYWLLSDVSGTRASVVGRNGLAAQEQTCTRQTQHTQASRPSLRSCSAGCRRRSQPRLQSARPRSQLQPPLCCRCRCVQLVCDYSLLLLVALLACAPLS